MRFVRHRETARQPNMPAREKHMCFSRVSPWSPVAVQGSRLERMRFRRDASSSCVLPSNSREKHTCFSRHPE